MMRLDRDCQRLVVHRHGGGARRSTGVVLAPVLLGAAVLLVVAGLYAVRSGSPWLGAALIVPGSMAGAVGLVWKVIVPIAGLVLIVLSIRQALQRRPDRL